MANKFYLNKAAYKGRKHSDENLNKGNSINNEKERTEKVGRLKRVLRSSGFLGWLGMGWESEG